MSDLDWSEGEWQQHGNDLETALQSQEAHSCAELNLYTNKVVSLPDCIGLLTNLTLLHLFDNQLRSLPDCIGQLTNLVQLYLHGNQLTSLPDSVGKLTNLIGLDVHRNQLKSLPHSMDNLEKLVYLLLKENSALPEQFKQNTFDHTGTQEIISDISAYYRKQMKMRDAARSAALFIIARYREGDLAVFPRDLISLIAHDVWKTRTDPIWLDSSE